jgi:nicotinamide-nucleotide amidase
VLRFGRDLGVDRDDSSAPVALGRMSGRVTLATMSAFERHRLLIAELLSIGTELTVGDTRDTNGGELARSLTSTGVRVSRMTALPDDLEVVTEAFRAGLDRADLVVSTGGLGPTPDDLTREAIAAALGETPTVDPALEAWLRELWARRGMPFPALNLKQAWLIPSAVAMPNPNGTAPGWFVGRPDGRVIVALPGPPREMRPMWSDEVLPRLQALGLGAPVASRTYRLTGIGESQVAELLGEGLLRATNPIVATYARVEAVDVRVSAVTDGERSADELVETASSAVLERLAGYVWATGETTWSDAIGARLGELGWTLAIVEIGTGGSLDALFGDAPWLRFDETISPDAPAAVAHGGPSDHGAPDDGDEVPDDLVRYARRARELGGAEVGLAVRTRPRTGDTAVAMAISTPDGDHRARRLVFLTGPMGRSRAALTAAAFLFEVLRELGPRNSG